MPTAEIIYGAATTGIPADAEALYDAAREIALAKTEIAQASLKAAEDQISALTQTAYNQALQLQRYEAAMLATNCPNLYIHTDEETHVTDTASVGECTSAGTCNCELGNIMTSPTWTPPPPSPPD